MTSLPAAPKIPWRFDDGFRSFITMLLALPMLVVPLWGSLGLHTSRHATVITALCLYVSVSFVLYVAWTHLVFVHPDTARVREIAKRQHVQRSSVLTRWSGLSSTNNWRSPFR